MKYYNWIIFQLYTWINTSPTKLGNNTTEYEFKRYVEHNLQAKMNRSMEIVRQGTGVHRDKTKYNRKTAKQQKFYDGYHCISSLAIYNDTHHDFRAKTL
jgi:hypothetical protein